MEKKKDLLLDIDHVFCFPGFLEAINDFLGSHYEIDDFTDYYIDKVAIPEERFDEFNEFLNQRNLYENAQILPYAIETIKELALFYNIYPCSSCINPFNIAGSGKLYVDKYYFLLEYLPFIQPEHYIFTNAKHLFRAAIQIDDRLDKLDPYVETRILFPAHHNKTISDAIINQKGVIRAGYDWRTGWIEVGNILLPTHQQRGEGRYLKK
ncbi:MAG: hypothetical protein HFI09_04520 [Bacilli bacterium]|nr:hypothetical protein [Bacilli bacterium]